MTSTQKALLFGEVLVAYAHARRYMVRQDIRAAVSAIRARPQPIRRGTAAPNSDTAWRVSVRLGTAAGRVLEMLPSDSRCLAQSLVVCQLLSARAIPCTLVIGARTTPEFAAHAWVEHAGRPVLPPRGFAESRLLEI